MLVWKTVLPRAYDMDKHQRTTVENKLPLGKMVNIVQGTNTDTGRERPGKCLGALLLREGCLLPWMTGMSRVNQRWHYKRETAAWCLFYGRPETKY